MDTMKNKGGDNDNDLWRKLEFECFVCIKCVVRIVKQFFSADILLGKAILGLDK
jgi:hypothetical protein